MDNIVRGGNWYFDTFNAWRVLDVVNLPEITFNTEAAVPGGHMMGADFPEDLASLKATIKLVSDDPRIAGLVGAQPGNYTTCTWYENLTSFRNGENWGRVITMRGLITSVKRDERKGLKRAMTEYEMGTIVYYQDVGRNGVTHRFDFFAGPGATVVKGVNPYAELAANIAIGGGTVL